MNDFAHLSGLDVSEKTTKFAVSEISTDAVLELKPANNTNTEYFNAYMSLTAARTTKNMSRTSTTEFRVEDLDADRELDKDLFPKYVIVGWTGVTTQDGTPIKWSVKKAIELIDMLSAPGVAWVFDKIRMRAKSPEAFVDWTELAPPTKELVKNSVSGSTST